MDKVKDYLPLASASFLIIGALRLIFFYNFFSIDIISYIDLSEIFSLSLSFFINSSIISLVFLVFFIPAVIDDYIKKEPNKKIAAVGVLFMFSFMVYWFFNTYDIFGDYVVGMRVNYDYIFFILFIISIPLLSRYIIPALKRRIMELFAIDLSMDVFFALMMIAGICSLCVLQARNAARDILLRRKSEYVEMKLGSTMIK